MRTPRLLLVPAVVAAVAVLGGPAYAGHATVHDASKDVVSLDGKPQPVPTDKGADITRFDTTLTHRRLDLGLRTRGTAPQGFSADLFIIATPHQAYSLFLTHDGGKEKTELRVYKSLKSNGAGKVVTCHGLRPHRAGSQVRVVVPGSCLGTPHWVRTEAVALDENGQDVAGIRGKFAENKPHLGRKVHA